MSDRLGQLTDQVHTLIQEKRDLKVEIDKLKANQIPGRCGECEHWWRPYRGDTGTCGLLEGRGNDPWVDYELLTERTDFCHKWKPKGE